MPANERLGWHASSPVVGSLARPPPKPRPGRGGGHHPGARGRVPGLTGSQTLRRQASVEPPLVGAGAGWRSMGSRPMRPDGRGGGLCRR